MTMPITFPDFRDTRCVAVGACGTLDTNEKAVRTLIDEPKGQVLVASYRISKSTAFIRVLLGGASPGHVHIDVYKREAFGAVPPKQTHKRKDIEKILDRFMGSKITTSSFGRFLLPIDELPKEGLILSTFFVKKQGDLSITMSGANFLIKGAPIRNIAWQFVKGGPLIRIDIDARIETEIRNDYLIKQIQLLDSGLRLFVLGRGTDGTE